MEEAIQKLAVLYADVSGSTRIYEKYGDTIARRDIKACIDIIIDIVNQHDGKLIKTIGDEAMCSFANPVMAAITATEIHETLQEASEQGKFEIGEMHVKIGWHFGEIYYRGSEIVGNAPVTAQQIINLAKADEILTSEQSIKVLPEDMQENAHFVDSLEAEAYTGKLNVYTIPWEESDEVTKFGPANNEKKEDSVISVLILNYRDQNIRLDSEITHCTIGRSHENDLSVNGKFTSRVHSEISYKHGSFYLKDVSTNGSAIFYAGGKVEKLRREELLLNGEGVICFGGLPEEDPEASVSFRCIRK
jgi:adenylate cyclase